MSPQAPKPYEPTTPPEAVPEVTLPAVPDAAIPAVATTVMPTSPKRRWVMITLICAAVLLLSGSAAAYFLVFHKSAPAKSVEPASSVATTTPPSPTAATVTSPAAATCTPADTMFITATAGLRLHNAKDNGAASKVALMPWAAQVAAGCGDGTWDQVSYGGQTGYALVQYLATADPSVFKIKELGIQFKITTDLANLKYQYVTQNGYSWARFSTTDLANWDSDCDTTGTSPPLGNIDLTGGAGEGIVATLSNGEKIYYASPQAVCGTPDKPNRPAIPAESFQNALKTITLTN